MLPTKSFYFVSGLPMWLRSFFFLQMWSRSSRSGFFQMWSECGRNVVETLFPQNAKKLGRPHSDHISTTFRPHLRFFVKNKCLWLPGKMETLIFSSKTVLKHLFFPNVVGMWSKCGRNVVEMWSECGRNVVEMWSRSSRSGFFQTRSLRQ